MNQITRINKYESILNAANKVIKKIDKCLDEYDDIQKNIKELDIYYGSELWYQDIDDFDNHLLPKETKAGVLSEDAIYNMLANNKEIAIKMLEIATKALKKI